MSASATPNRLSNTQHRHFHDEGYVIVKDAFDPADLEPVRRELEAQIDTKIRSLVEEGKLIETYPNEPFDRRAARITHDSRENGEAIMRFLEGPGGGGHKGREMFNVITHPKLLAIIESLVGPEIVGSSVYRVRPKMPKLGRGIVPWHQDSGYFATLCDAHLIVTCWIPLIDATEYNGCLRIAPRAHRNGVATHHTGGNSGFLVIEDQDVPLPPEGSVVAECPRGGVVLMTNLTPHCSTPNHSDDIRWSLDLRYQSDAVPHNAHLLPTPDQDALPPDFQVACYAPEADFYVQSRAHPERVTSYETYVARRSAYDQAAGKGKIPYPNRGWQPVAPPVATPSTV